MSEQSELWHVQLENGEVRELTLDQLDAFYQNGIIDEQSYVFRDGDVDWRTLGDVLCGEAEPEPEPAASVPLPWSSLSADATIQESIRPFVSDIDPDEYASPLPDASVEAVFRKSPVPKYAVAGGIVAAVLVMSGIVVASRSGSRVSAHVSEEVAASMAHAAQETTAQPIPPPSTAHDGPSPHAAATSEAPKPLPEDLKKALADKDTQFNQKQDQRKQARQRALPAATHKSSSPFSKNGNAFDPLNAKL